ncbi:MAG: ribosome maturation factor RimM [Terriglobales bacterium]
MEDEYITLARILKTQGRHGEVGAETHSDVPDRFRQGMRLLSLDNNGSRRELELEQLWPHKGILVLKFAGVDSISEAELLVGCELQVPRAQRAALDPGWLYISDLIGCEVFDSDREIGTVEDVQFGAGEAPLLIVKTGHKRHEIPYAEAYLKHVDLKSRRIEMVLPDGMLEVNAPLTADEKRQEQRNVVRKR